VVAAVRFFTEVLVFDRVTPGSVVVLPTSVELMELMGQVWARVKEGFSNFQIFVVKREDRVDREWSK